MLISASDVERAGPGWESNAMAKVAAELPESVQPTDGSEKVNVDDLMAQMASEEIDRLLADSENATEPAEAPTDPPASAPEPSPASAPARTENLGDEVLSKQLGDLFTATDESAVAAPEIQASGPQPENAEPETATTTDERAALEAALLDDPAPEAPVLAEPVHELEDRVPFYLKPLVWVNSPLDPYPDALRDLIGKLALLTMFNATAVLVYLFLFRRHHH